MFSRPCAVASKQIGYDEDSLGDGRTRSVRNKDAASIESLALTSQRAMKPRSIFRCRADQESVQIFVVKTNQLTDLSKLHRRSRTESLPDEPLRSEKDLIQLTNAGEIESTDYFDPRELFDEFRGEVESESDVESVGRPTSLFECLTPRNAGSRRVTNLPPLAVSANG